MPALAHIQDILGGLMRCSKTASSFDQVVHADGHQPFAERDVMEYRSEFPDHSGLIPADWITLAHFSVSSAMSLPKSAGEPASTVPPRVSVRRALILGSARPALISLLSLSTMSAGVFLGAPTPKKVLASWPGTNSATVGMSGRASERVAVVIASRRSLPALTYWIDEGPPPK